jgi:predicted RNase H-like nuclease (RuvC/YqgF family)
LVIPEAVLTANDADKTKGLKYESPIPVLTKVMQELKAANDNLQREVEEDRRQIAWLKSKVRTVKRN